MISELSELNRARLELDLTFEELGERLRVHPRTVHRILTTPNARVHDRTLFKIQRFLSSVTKKGAAA